MLSDIYSAQRSLNHRTVGFDVCSIEDEDTRLVWFRNYLTAWDQELKELLESLDRDAISRGAPSVGFELDVKNARVEVVDMLHFLVSMFQVIGEPGIVDGRVPGAPVGFEAFLEALAREHGSLHGEEIPADPDMATMNRLLLLHGVHAAVETGRVLDKVRWKWWARQENRWGDVREALYGSLFPRWCLLVLSTGMDAPAVSDLYMKKNRLNLERQEQGYREGTYVKVDAQGREDNVKLFEK